MEKPMFWEKVILGEKEEIFPTSRVGGCMLYIPEKKAYLIFGGENNTIVNYLNRLQAKQTIATPAKSSNASGISAAAPKITPVATGKNDKIYFYDIGLLAFHLIP